MTLHRVLLLAFMAVVPSACRTDGSPAANPPDVDAAESASEDRSTAAALLLYLPNRVLDLLDVVRFGVNVGPGLGVDVQATDALRAAIISYVSVGIGYQTLRHLPIQVGPEASFGVGPLGARGGAILPWHRSGWDVRIELYLLLIGAHVAIEPMEVVDFVTGIIGIDVAGDDL